MNKNKNIFEATGGRMTKNDIMSIIGSALVELSKDQRGELITPTYNFHITIKSNLKIRKKRV